MVEDRVLRQDMDLRRQYMLSGGQVNQLQLCGHAKDFTSSSTKKDCVTASTVKCTVDFYCTEKIAEKWVLVGDLQFKHAVVPYHTQSMAAVLAGGK